MGLLEAFRRRWRPVLVVAALGLLAAGCIPEGTHEVSSFGAGGISPGLWRTLGGNDCSWVRRSSSGAVLSSIRSFGGPRYVQVDASDATFAQQGCVPFWSEPGPFAKPLRDPLARTPFREGDWMLGYELDRDWYYSAPGAAPGGQCRWVMASDWHHVSGEVVWYGVYGPGPLMIRMRGPSDVVGFTSQGCGDWTPSNADPSLIAGHCEGPAAPPPEPPPTPAPGPVAVVPDCSGPIPVL